MRNLYIAVGIVGIAVGSIGILMLVAPNVPPTKPVKFRWSPRYATVPDSYDPTTDGPVWLGPYRFSPPTATQIGVGTPDIGTFQMLVEGDKVSFLKGGTPSDNSWVIHNTIAYSVPVAEREKYGGVAIEAEARTWIYTWIPPSTIRATLPSVRRGDGREASFLCDVPKTLFSQAYPSRDLAQIAEVHAKCH